MKFTINRNLFLDNLNSIVRAISSWATIPIFSGIKVDLSNEELVLTGSDTDISIEIKIPVSAGLTVESTESIVLPARFFNEIIKKLSGKDFSFEVKEGLQTQISSENNEFIINGLDTDNYPRLPEIVFETAFEISGKTFREITNETNFAISTQESRLILTGVRFTFNQAKIKAVATDSHRLSQRIIDLENGPQIEAGLIIPGKSLVELSRITGDQDPKVAISPGDSQVLFVTGNVSFYSRLLEGIHPDTDCLLPITSTTAAEFDHASLSRAFDHASLLAHAGRDNIVKLTLNTENGVTQLEGNLPEIGTIEEKPWARQITGQNLEISFNPDYLQAALRASITDTVIMNFTEPLRPFTVVPGKEDVEFIQLIIPVKAY